MIGPALMALVKTKLEAGVNLVAVVAPEFGERRKQSLEDIALLTGAELITHDTGKLLQDVELRQLGQLKHIHITQTNTSFTPKNIDTEEIKEHVESIREQLKTMEDGFQKDRAKERLAKLTNGVAVIKVGGGSGVEVDEKRERVIDSVNALKAAINDGVIAGGGVALKNIAITLSLEGIEYQSNERTILDLVTQSLRAPIEKLLDNSGIVFDYSKLEGNEGFDLITGKKVDMFEAGIIDPVKVTKMAVKHAFSVAALFLTTDVLIVDEEQKGVQKMELIQR